MGIMEFILGLVGIIVLGLVGICYLAFKYDAIEKDIKKGKSK